MDTTVLWGAKHTFCQILGANLVVLLIEIPNIGGAKAPQPPWGDATAKEFLPIDLYLLIQQSYDIVTGLISRDDDRDDMKRFPQIDV